MKSLFLFFLILFAINLKAVEYKEYVLKFKNYDETKISEYKKDFNIKKYFSLDNQKLLSLKLEGEKLSGNKLADLRTYFLIELTENEFKNIKYDKNISSIYENIKNIPRPTIAVDIAPATSNWTQYQGYIDDFENHTGLNAKYGWQFVGGRGENVTVVDIEGGWTHDHEDLGIEDPNLYSENGQNLTGTPMDGESHDNNHGTSVLGEIASANNEYGTTGIAHESNIKVINDYSKEYGYSTADAIIRGISVLDKGSVILLESQKGGPNYKYNPVNPGSQYGLVPDEWLSAEFDAIKTATSNGFVIIEAGANGEQNLDSVDYHTCDGDVNTYFTDNHGTEPCFDVNTRDSGAIIVGAGNPPSGSWGVTMAKMYYTSYGKRVDVQAWGMEIYTTGYGDLFYPNNDDKQAYTTQFGGTSGASPMITGVAALLQSRYKQKNPNKYLTSIEIREILKNNGHPQNGNELTEHIGPLPDIKLIFENYLNDVYNCVPKCSDWEYCLFEEANCKPKENMCNVNEDCSSDKDCNTVTHECVDPCILLDCKEWQTCENRACLLNEGRCNNDGDCLDTESCNPVVNKCVDPCVNVSCLENSYCLRLEENTRAECVCNDNYLLNNENICEYVEPTVTPKKTSSSCDYSSEGSKSSYLFIMFFLFLIYKKRYNL
jgi:hypothetical protein